MTKGHLEQFAELKVLISDCASDRAFSWCPKVDNVVFVPITRKHSREIGSAGRATTAECGLR